MRIDRERQAPVLLPRESEDNGGTSSLVPPFLFLGVLNGLLLDRFGRCLNCRADKRNDDSSNRKYAGSHSETP